jgi:hypothetical protein
MQPAPATRKPSRWSKAKPYVLRGGIVLLVLWLSFLAVVNHKMHQTPEEFGQFMKHVPFPAYFVLPFETLWTRARAGHVQIGDSAPDFKLKTLDKKSEVTLADLRGKSPVVLIFGSYT